MKRTPAKDLHRPVHEALLTEEGQKLCREMRRETWFRLMATSSDPTMRRLGAGIFVAAAMNEMVASRASWGSPQRQRKPRIARADRPRRAPREPRLSADRIAEIRASDEMGRVLARRYGVSESTISRARQGSPKPNRSQLTPAQQTVIRTSRESISSLARSYGVSWSTVARLRKSNERGRVRPERSESEALVSSGGVAASEALVSCS